MKWRTLSILGLVLLMLVLVTGCANGLEHVLVSPDFGNIMIGATIVSIHQHGAGAKGDNNFKSLTLQRWNYD